MFNTIQKNLIKGLLHLWKKRFWYKPIFLYSLKIWNSSMLLKMTEKMFTLKTTSSGLQVCRLNLKVRCTTEISDIRVELAMLWRTCTINKRKSNGCRGRYPTLQPNNVNQFLLLLNQFSTHSRSHIKSYLLEHDASFHLYW